MDEKDKLVEDLMRERDILEARAESAEAKVEVLRKVMEEAARRIEKLASDMEPPNRFTPELLMLVEGMRRAALASINPSREGE